jgi:SPP1 gp7 family putative phage head morphogenesis protein
MHVTHKAARTVALVRMLHASNGHRRRGGRLPRQQQPDAIRREYNATLQSLVVQPAARAFARVASQIIRLLIEERREQGKNDSARERQAAELVEQARRAATVSDREMRAVAEKFGQRTSDFQKAQLDRQVKAAVGVPYSAIEKPARDLLPTFVDENVDLITSISERYFDSLKAQIQDAFASGMHPETLAEELSGREEVSEWDARRIARDQIGKLAADLNQERQKSLGVTGYTWRGAMDNRERDEHRALEGQHFEWDNPPAEGNPGEPILCRCTAEPDFSDVVDGTYDENNS